MFFYQRWMNSNRYLPLHVLDIRLRELKQLMLVVKS